VAIAVHSIAVTLFQRGHCIHDALWKTKDAAYSIDAVTTWREDLGRPDLNPDPTLFSHFSYMAVGQYPNGLADIVGYWAENKVLGGVVIFDRSDSWDDDKSEPNVYFHSDRSQVTFRIWQLLDEQQQALVNFLFSSPTPVGAPGPFPLTASAKNLARFDPEVATGCRVYRDIWEREPPSDESPHCVHSSHDYPEGCT
jgi:hypothetical protein